ncbi:hypothetical protein BHM03_00007180 [Ensete ventricosum]|nr:hypothetical protein BHM03_00007180 [Ensete ventricosum]
MKQCQIDAQAFCPQCGKQRRELFPSLSRPRSTERRARDWTINAPLLQRYRALSASPPPRTPPSLAGNAGQQQRLIISLYCSPSQSLSTRISQIPPLSSDRKQVMEGRARKYSGLASPESAREWAEPPSPPPLPQGRKIPVVYYLYRNRHLEHPHFIEVPLSSPDGLYLRGLPSYKNGFVWHDLAEDDLVLPANGNEYVLKGSELLDPSPSDRIHQSNGNSRLLNLKPQQQENPAISRAQEAAGSSSSSPASSVIKQPKPPPSPPSPRDDEHSPLLHCPGLGPLPRPPPSWQNSLLGPTEYPAYKSVIAADASTQTDDDGDINARGGMLTDDSSVDLEFDKRRRKHDHRSKERLETSGDAISPAPTSWSNSSSSGSGKMETLESLIRADASKIKSFRMLKEEEEEALFHTKPKLRPTNVLMQLITCGSISLKDHHSFGLVPTYRPRLSHVNLSSTVFGGSMMLGELDYLSEHPRLMGSRVENKECFSHVDRAIVIESALSRVIVISSTLGHYDHIVVLHIYNSIIHRNCKTPDSEQGMGKLMDSSRSKCLPRTTKIAFDKQPKNEAIMSSISDGSRKSSAGLDRREVSQSENQRITLSVDESSASVESTKERKEKVIMIEESYVSPCP